MSCESASVAQLHTSIIDDRRLWVRPPPSRHHASIEIDHEIFSKVILSLPDLLLTYSGQLGYITVNLFSTFRTFDDTYLYSFTRKKKQKTKNKKKNKQKNKTKKTKKKRWIFY